MADVSPGKPRDRDGYIPDDLLQVRSTCLTVAATLGAQLDRLCIVGGLVPSLLIDERFGPDPDTEAGHPGTHDLDVAMSVALLDDQGYEEISTRLRQEGFGPDRNANGNATPQRWKLGSINVTVDFLLPPFEKGPLAGRIQPLEPDFAALIIPGIELVADERESIDLSGHTLDGQRITRSVPVCGPEHIGPQRAAAFDTLRSEDFDAAAADAHGYIDDLLASCARHGLVTATSM